MIELDKAKPGDLAEVYMSAEGQINQPEWGGVSRQFEIIAIGKDTNHNSYYVLVSYKSDHFYGSRKLEIDNLRSSPDYDINLLVGKVPNLSDYRGHYVRWLNDDRVNKIIKLGPDGCGCQVCKEFYNMAVPNQPDGTLVCYSCRQNPMRAYY